MEPLERVRGRAWENATLTERDDVLAVEEPLELRVRGADERDALPFVTTMRTPGHDEELAAGLLVSEGVLEQRTELLALERHADPRAARELRDNVLVATLAPAALARARQRARSSVMGSACGVCGRTRIEALLPAGSAPPTDATSFDAALLCALPARLRARQSIFAATGGLHAAALFDEHGALLEVREDIGRHNATDKVLGHAWLAGTGTLASRGLLVSGRAGFEIVQKAHLARVPLVASVSAPSSLAVELAEAAGITLVGFLREGRFNVYAHPTRVRTPRA